jgi:4-amino-4-deoxy-L-arabinose transferase-like glycosyltransferase
MLDCQMFGLNAGGHHFTNVLLHTLAVVLLFLFLLQVTGAPWRSAFVAAVFAVHPLRVESVAWIAERKDVLSAVFLMLTLLAYARYVSGERSLLRYLLVAFSFALGLMAKPMLVTLPLVLLLLDYWPPPPLRFPLVGKGRKLRASLHLFPPRRRKDSSLSLEPPLLAPHLVGSAGIHAVNHRDPAGATR